MPAEPAAAPGAPGESASGGQSQANGAAAQEPQTPQQQRQEPLQVPIGDRTEELNMLDLLDVPTVVRDRVRELNEEEEGKAESEKLKAERGQNQPAAASNEEVDDTWPESARQRVGRLTAKREELKTQLSEKDAEIARLKAESGKLKAETGAPEQQQQQPPGESNTPYANLKDESEISEQVRVAREVRNWALTNLEGAVDVPIGADNEGNVKTKDFSAAEIRRMLVDANNALEVHLPSRLQELREERQTEVQRQDAEVVRPKYEEITTEEYPDLKNPESELSQHVERALHAYPFLKRAPDGRLVAADIVSKLLGRRDRLAQAGLMSAPPARVLAASAPTIDPKVAPFLAPKPPRAPAVPSSQGSPPPPTTDSEAAQKQAREEYVKSSQTEEDFTLFVERMSQAQSANGHGAAAPARV